MTSDVLPLPRTWRPHRARIVALAVAGLVMAVTITIAVILPHDGARPWGLADRLGIVAVGAGVAYVLLRQALVHATADDKGVHVVNLFRARRLEWAEIINVSMRRGDPWLMLDLADGTTVAVMGIQASDGARALSAAGELKALVAAHGRREGAG